MASKKDFYLPKALQIGMGSYYSFNGPSSTLSCDSQWNNRSVFSFQSRVYGWVQFGHEPDQYSPIIFLYHLWTCFLKHASPCCTLHNIQGRRYRMKPKSLFMVIQHFAVWTVLYCISAFFPMAKKHCMKKVQYAAGVKVKEVALVHITLSILVEVL